MLDTAPETDIDYIRNAIMKSMQRAHGDRRKAEQLYEHMIVGDSALRRAIAQRDFANVSVVAAHLRVKPNTDADGQYQRVPKDQIAHATASVSLDDGEANMGFPDNGRVNYASPSSRYNGFDARAAEHKAALATERRAASAIFTLHDGKDIADVTFGSLHRYLIVADKQGAFVRILLRDYASANPGDLVGSKVPPKSLRAIKASVEKEMAA